MPLAVPCGHMENEFQPLTTCVYAWNIFFSAKPTIWHHVAITDWAYGPIQREHVAPCVNTQLRVNWGHIHLSNGCNLYVFRIFTTDRLLTFISNDREFLLCGIQCVGGLLPYVFSITFYWIVAVHLPNKDLDLTRIFFVRILGIFICYLFTVHHVVKNYFEFFIQN